MTCYIHKSEAGVTSAGHCTRGWQEGGNERGGSQMTRGGWVVGTA